MTSGFGELAVAHFRRWVFELTETFLYNQISCANRSTPICITIERHNVDAFPLDTPIVELYSWKPLAVWMRRISAKLLRVPRHRDPVFDHPRTYREIQKHRVSVLHCHFGYTGFEVLPVKRRSGLPMVTTFYGHDVSVFPRQEVWRRNFSQLFRDGEVFITEGPVMKDRLVELGCEPDKVHVVKLGICLEKYQYSERRSHPPGRGRRVLFCGRFTEKKGLIYALKAVRRSREVLDDIELHIIGDGDLRAQIEAFIVENQMTSYTYLHGSQSHERVIDELQKADLLLVPSVTGSDGDSEGGAPTVLLEAQACGVPIVASRHADIPNVVVEGGSALLSEERDDSMLARHILEVLHDPARWSRMGEVGRRFVEQNHDVSSQVATLEDIYVQLSENRSRLPVS
jgi:glycosyltransferase involved in cell wall biosynthesis